MPPSYPCTPPTWGGTAAKNMVTNATGIPTDFDPGKVKKGSGEIDMATTKHLVWAARTGSQSHRAPTIAGGKVLIGTNNEMARDKKYVGDRGVLMCFDEKTGEFLWQLVVPKLGTGAVRNRDQPHICSSALIHKNRAYVITNRCQVACLDLDGLANGNDGPFKDETTYAAKFHQPPVKLAKTDADIIWLFDMRNGLALSSHGTLQLRATGINRYHSHRFRFTRGDESVRIIACGIFHRDHSPALSSGFCASVWAICSRTMRRSNPR